MSRYSVLGLLEANRRFSPKGVSEHTGDFSRYSVLGLPGQGRIFLPKAEEGGGWSKKKKYLDKITLSKRLTIDEIDMNDILTIIIASGVLDE